MALARRAELGLLAVEDDQVLVLAGREDRHRAVKLGPCDQVVRLYPIISACDIEHAQATDHVAIEVRFEDVGVTYRDNPVHQLSLIHI